MFRTVAAAAARSAPAQSATPDTAMTSTTTTFSVCRVSGNASGFASATVTLYDERGLLPDQSKGSKTNRCGKSDWGVMTRSDRYHWTISKINGTSYAPELRLSVNSVRQTY